MDDLDINGRLLRNDQDTREKIIYKYVYHEFVLCHKEFVHQDQKFTVCSPQFHENGSKYSM